MLSRRPQATIDLAALEHNFARVKQLAPHSKILAVLKANAYGHGVREVVGRRVHRIGGEWWWSAHRCHPSDFPPGGNILYEAVLYTIIILIGL